MMDQVQMGLILILQQMCVSMNVIWPVVMIVLLLSLAEMAMVQESIENHQESRLLDVVDTLVRRYNI